MFYATDMAPETGGGGNQVSDILMNIIQFRAY